MTGTRDTAPALLPDIVAPDLDIIFVGAAPSHWAAASGHYYDGPRNRFWLLLAQAGLTPRRMRPDEDTEVLRYGIGMTAVFRNIASSANHLLPSPTPEHRQSLHERLVRVSPRWVCYNGKDVHRMCTGHACVEWGEQDERVGLARVYVTPSTSGRADRWGRERLALFTELRQLARGCD